MAMATVLSRAQHGMDAPQVRVEVDISSGLPAFAIVGLPEAVVKESKDRVRAAIANCNFEIPAGRITVNLSPADLPKEGGRFDLPIAVGILLASGQLPGAQLEQCELYGELSLSGEIQPVKGALLAALAASKAGHRLIVPPPNAAEAQLVTRCPVATAKHLLEVAAHATKANPLTFAFGAAPGPLASGGLDLADVHGQAQARRALEIAAAGQHSLLFIGPPGTGKSMLAQRLPGLLPAMSESEALEVAAIRSIIGATLAPKEWRIRPFRSPHHTASAIALVGGGAIPRPGEVTLAHNGVLFLDELPEYDRRVLEVLREPLENGSITVSRAAQQLEFPARFQLIAAMNPCPCGYLGDSAGRCRCTQEKIARYRSKISGPLLDRLDMHVEVPRVPVTALRASLQQNESTQIVAARVLAARERQLARQKKANAHLANRELELHCRTSRTAADVLERATAMLGLSARAHHRILRVARTIADLAGEDEIGAVQISEAVALRRFDRARAPSIALVPVASEKR